MKSLNNKKTPLLSKKESRDHLKFGQVKAIPFSMFLKESSLFAINYVADNTTVPITFMFFNITNSPKNIAILGFCFTFYFRLMCLSFNFQEPISIILGPYYSQKDTRNYNLNFWRLVFLNIIMFLLNSTISDVIIKPLYIGMNLEERFVEEYTMFTIYFIIFIGPIYTLTNFCRGSLHFCVT